MQFNDPLPIELTPTVELAIYIKTICDEYGLQQEDLAKIAYGGVEYVKTVKKVRQLPIQVPIEPILAPKSDLTRAGVVYPMLDITMTRALHCVYAHGIHEMLITTQKSGKIRCWFVRSILEESSLCGPQFIVVERKNLKALYRYFKTRANTITHIEPPILRRGVLEDIWKNSIGFLESSSTNREKFKEYNIPVKRGIMLAGRAGCGKTMCCKWLRQSCQKRGLEHRVVTMEDYRRAHSRGNISSLFSFHGDARGIVFFDDMDIMFEDREKGNFHLADFLTNLDGCEPKEGVVFIFTSNKTEGLDEAFMRPGRIDSTVIFDAPNKELRRRFILERFPPNVLAQINVDELVERTELSTSQRDSGTSTEFPYTYAELEEVRKLLALDDINKGHVNLDDTLRLFDIHRKEFNERISHFGFKRLEEEDNDEFYYDPSYGPAMYNVAGTGCHSDSGCF